MSRFSPAALHRSRARLADKLRIDDPLVAYAVCCFASTATIAAFHLFLIAMLALSYGGWSGADALQFVDQGLVVWLYLTILGFAVAAPFVPVATLIGARLRIESLAYYAGFGGLIMTVLIFALVGLPRLDPFGFSVAAWTIGPPCAVAWGAWWWYLHRKWKAATR